VTARRRLRVLVCVVAALAAVPAAAQTPTRDAAYAALGQLPDWSGWWALDTVPPEEFRAQPPAPKPGLVSARPPPVDPQRYCRPRASAEVTTIAMLACVIPALHAANVEPLRALRVE
jgi:hypothetical protein